MSLRISPKENLRRSLRHKRGLVLGLGQSGLAATRLLIRLGASVSVSDRRTRSELARGLEQLPPGIPLQTESHSWLRNKKFDFVVISPGVHWDLPELERLRRRGVPLWNELGLALELIKPLKIAAITGTNGKTTTTTLLTRMIKENRSPCVMAGNIGTPLSSVVDRVGPGTILILEVSSYQLEGLRGFKPHVGCLLNITPDHLQRHKTMARYAQIKFNMFDQQGPGDWAILNADDAWSRKLAVQCPGQILWLSSLRELPGQGFVTAGSRQTSGDRSPLVTGLFLDRAVPPLKLPRPRHLIGPHNVFNALAASACAWALGASGPAIARALLDFKGVDHRCQPVRTLEGVLYVNDSKSTNVDSTRVALQSFDQPILLILGGQHKGSPYTPLAPLVQRQVKRIFLIGEAAPLIHGDLDGSVPMERSGELAEALRRARSCAKSGDVVLLSPACASFDQFENFEHRGRVFADLVLRLR